MTSYVDRAVVKLDAQETISAALKRVQAEVSATIARAMQIRGAFVKAFAGVQSRINGIASGIGNIGGSLQGLGTRLIVGGGAVTGLIGGAINAAGDLVEINNRFDALFQGQSKNARGFAATLGDAVGRSQPQLLGLLSDFQGLATGLRMDEIAAREFSQTMTQATLDLASFNNLSDQEASERMLSALTGSSEVLRKFGVDISAAALKSRGISESATELEKVRERFRIIEETLRRQNAWGDAEKTANSYSNTMKRLGAVIQDGAAAIGTALLPEVTKFVDWSVGAAKAASQWITQNIGLVKTIAAAAVGVTALGVAAVVTGSALTGIASGITIFSALLSPIGIFTGLVVAAAAAVFDFKKVGSNIATGFLESWNSILQAVNNGDLKSAFELVTLEIQRVWLEMLDEMKFRWLLFRYNLSDKLGLTALVDVEGEIAEMEKPLKELEKRIKEVQARIAQSVKDAANKAAADKFAKGLKNAVAKIDVHHVMPKFGAQPENPLAGYDMSGLRNDLRRDGLGSAMQRVIQQLDGLSLRSQESVNAFVQAANGARVEAIDRQTAVLEQLRDLMRDSPERIGEEVGDAIDETNGVVGLHRT